MSRSSSRQLVFVFAAFCLFVVVWFFIASIALWAHSWGWKGAQQLNKRHYYFILFFHLLLLLSIPVLRSIAVSVASESVVAFLISCFHSRRLSFFSFPFLGHIRFTVIQKQFRLHLSFRERVLFVIPLKLHFSQIRLEPMFSEEHDSLLHILDHKPYSTNVSTILAWAFDPVLVWFLTESSLPLFFRFLTNSL